MVTMTWKEAMETEIARSRHERYRWLCSDDNPSEDSREAYRRLMVQIVEDAPPDPDYVAKLPPLGGCCGG